jgi:hypothetical protein
MSGSVTVEQQLKAAQEELAAARKYMQTYAAELHAEVKPKLDAAKVLSNKYAKVQEDLKQKVW